MVSIGDFAA
jgi:molybdenum cofactor biosynthesis enzyme MoaA